MKYVSKINELFGEMLGSGHAKEDPNEFNYRPDREGMPIDTDERGSGPNHWGQVAKFGANPSQGGSTIEEFTKGLNLEGTSTDLLRKLLGV